MPSSELVSHQLPVWKHHGGQRSPRAPSVLSRSPWVHSRWRVCRPPWRGWAVPCPSVASPSVPWSWSHSCRGGSHASLAHVVCMFVIAPNNMQLNYSNANIIHLYVCFYTTYVYVLIHCAHKVCTHMLTCVHVTAQKLSLLCTFSYSSLISRLIGIVIQAHYIQFNIRTLAPLAGWLWMLELTLRLCRCPLRWVLSSLFLWRSGWPGLARGGRRWGRRKQDSHPGEEGGDPRPHLHFCCLHVHIRTMYSRISL